MTAASVGPLEAQLLAQLETSLWIFDIDHSRVLWANPAALRVWQATSLEELQQRDLAADMTPAVADRLKQYQVDFEASGAEFREQWTLYPGGRPVSLNLRYSGYRLPDGRMAMLCEGRPVTEADPESLRSVEALLHTPLMIGLYSLDGRALYRNPAARKAVAVDSVRLQDRFPDPEALAALLALVEARGVATATLRTQTVLGERWHEVSIHRRRDAVTGDAAWLVSEVDVTLLKQSEAHARFLSEHDVLTGLPNRAHAQRYFALMQERAQHTASGGLQTALILIDVDHFKYVNDTWGHATGDELLKRLAQRLAASVRSTDLVARFGGDEFLMIVSSPDARREVALIHERLQRAMADPLHLSGVTVPVFVTAGASLCPDHGTDFDLLLQHADLALYEGKAHGRNRLEFYEEGMAESLRLRAQQYDPQA